MKTARRLRPFKPLLSVAASVMVAALVFSACSGAPDSSEYDVAINDGRVIDPESGLDAVRSIGIRGGAIAAISESPLRGRTVIEARGLVVAPGFIDLHSHGQTEENYRYKAMDGVTTALEMEVGAGEIARWYGEREGNALVNFGATVGHIPVRMKIAGDTGDFLPRDAAITKKLSADELAELGRLIGQGLDEGALGIGFGIAYVPAATRPEILDLFTLAAERRVPVYAHLRSHGEVEPGSAVEAAQEAIANAASTGASLHIVHVTSTGLGQTATLIRMIEGARRNGLDVTTESYPYTAAMTRIDSAIFSEGWQEKMNITYGDLQWVTTGERLTAETFARYRKEGGLVIAHSIPEPIARLAVSNPQIMVASDGILSDGKGHPRSAGSFARVLGRYVREQNALSLADAIRKMSYLPAERLSGVAASMKNKGRIKAGADADIVVFDAAGVIDRATFENPAQYSEGFRWVLVNGVAVVQNGQLADGVKPGRGVRKER
ncbi:MAG: amidohydrolase family protein [Blastocatellales bacterium]|nr:amidohydrolase family protein [Blastocatellales bacterium]